jgi:hypothetical protein
MENKEKTLKSFQIFIKNWLSLILDKNFIDMGSRIYTFWQLNFDVIVSRFFYRMGRKYYSQFLTKFLFGNFNRFRHFFKSFRV